mmetsp:Transcript_7159/g.12979  ORF Transcript_7159/g.12979 Transcript_7159/m.12979 type:complete len:499 (-) Transcript_7159:64-1560(-)
METGTPAIIVAGPLHGRFQGRLAPPSKPTLSPFPRRVNSLQNFWACMPGISARDTVQGGIHDFTFWSAIETIGDTEFEYGEMSVGVLTSLPARLSTLLLVALPLLVASVFFFLVVVVVVTFARDTASESDHDWVGEHHLRKALQAADLSVEDGAGEAREQHAEKGLRGAQDLDADASLLVGIPGGRLGIDQAVPHRRKRRPAQLVRVREPLVVRVRFPIDEGGRRDALGPVRSAPHYESGVYEGKNHERHHQAQEQHGEGDAKRPAQVASDPLVDVAAAGVFVADVRLAQEFREPPGALLARLRNESVLDVAVGRIIGLGSGTNAGFVLFLRMRRRLFCADCVLQCIVLHGAGHSLQPHPCTAHSSHGMRLRVVADLDVLLPHDSAFPGRRAGLQVVLGRAHSHGESVPALFHPRGAASIGPVLPRREEGLAGGGSDAAALRFAAVAAVDRIFESGAGGAGGNVRPAFAASSPRRGLVAFFRGAHDSALGNVGRLARI